MTTQPVAHALASSITASASRRAELPTLGLAVLRGRAEGARGACCGAVLISLFVGLRAVRARLARDGVKEFAKALDVLGVVDLKLLHDDLVSGLFRACFDFAPEVVVRRGVEESGDGGELLAPPRIRVPDEHDGERALAVDLCGRPVDLANIHDVAIVSRVCQYRATHRRARAATVARSPQRQSVPEC